MNASLDQLLIVLFAASADNVSFQMRLSSLITLLLLALLGWVIWDDIGVREWVARQQPQAGKPLDPAFLRLSPLEVAALPLAVRFDHPMGSANAALTYNAQPFRITRHLGDDLNGIGGGNSDLGDAVYAAGAGRVVYSGVPGQGWGKMVILAHRVPDLENLTQEQVYQTVYAHLDEILVHPDALVERGDKIGTVGTGGGLYLAHLHFEVREGPYINPGQGYADSPLNRVSPEKFIAQRRGAPDWQLNNPPKVP